jgi:hypothetical protein
MFLTVFFHRYLSFGGCDYFVRSCDEWQAACVASSLNLFIATLTVSVSLRAFQFACHEFLDSFVSTWSAGFFCESFTCCRRSRVLGRTTYWLEEDIADLKEFARINVSWLWLELGSVVAFLR